MARKRNASFINGRTFSVPWAAFAKSGNPDSAGGVAWPKFDAAKEASIEFGSDGVKTHEHQFKARLDVAEKLQPKSWP